DAAEAAENFRALTSELGGRKVSGKGIAHILLPLSLRTDATGVARRILETPGLLSFAAQLDREGVSGEEIEEIFYKLSLRADATEVVKSFEALTTKFVRWEVSGEWIGKIINNLSSREDAAEAAEEFSILATQLGMRGAIGEWIGKILFNLSSRADATEAAVNLRLLAVTLHWGGVRIDEALDILYPLSLRSNATESAKEFIALADEHSSKGAGGEEIWGILYKRSLVEDILEELRHYRPDESYLEKERELLEALDEFSPGSFYFVWIILKKVDKKVLRKICEVFSFASIVRLFLLDDWHTVNGMQRDNRLINTKLFMPYLNSQAFTKVRCLLIEEQYSTLQRMAANNTVAKADIVRAVLFNNLRSIMEQTTDLLRIAKKFIMYYEWRVIWSYSQENMQEVLSKIFSVNEVELEKMILKCGYRFYEHDGIKKIIPLVYDVLLSGYSGTREHDSDRAESMTALMSVAYKYARGGGGEGRGARGNSRKAAHGAEAIIEYDVGFAMDENENRFADSTEPFAFGLRLTRDMGKRIFRLKDALLSMHMQNLLQGQLKERQAKQIIAEVFEAISRGGIPQGQIQKSIDLLSKQVKILWDDCGLEKGYKVMIYGALNETFYKRLFESYTAGIDNQNKLREIMLKGMKELNKREKVKTHPWVEREETLLDYLTYEREIREYTFDDVRAKTEKDEYYLTVDRGALKKLPIEAWDFSLKTGGEKGTRPGAEFTLAAQNGPEIYYVKFAEAGNSSHIWSEQLANVMYRLAGVPVADTKIVKVDNVCGFASRMLLLEGGENPGTRKQQLKHGFLMDVFMANWDIPRRIDNNTKASKGVLYRIDNGGALLFIDKAGGKRKDKNEFGPGVPVRELEYDAGNKDLHFRTRQIYEGLGLTITDIAKQAVILERIFKNETIDYLIENTHLMRREKEYLK
ncbi:MAG: hypothetical protein KAS66_09060, partial [Candidatus Omnitrophica bacterium]|nr:hypothetical protein [Candidatus Omnitrophota bacterium]